MKKILGLTHHKLQPVECNRVLHALMSPSSPLFAGASAATMLIFILPAAFYLRLVKSLPYNSWQKVLVRVHLPPLLSSRSFSTKADLFLDLKRSFLESSTHLQLFQIETRDQA